MGKRLTDFLKRETVLCVAAVCALITMVLVPPDGEYWGYIDLRVLCLLLSLMAVVAGVTQAGLFRWLTYQLLRRMSDGRALSVTLVLLPFFCSMLVTNDVALLVFVPFSLALLAQLGAESAMIPILVLQTIGANLGSMATPVGRKKATPAKAAPTSACIVTIHQRLVRNRSTKGLHRGLIIQGR